MKLNLLPLLIAVVMSLAVQSAAPAQNSILAQMYGQGVHAYYAGHLTEANEYFSLAISNGTNDPRVYYFRGIVAHARGNSSEAEMYWRQGAELEAQGRSNALVGRALTRFQGSARLELEEIRQKARLQAMATRAARSDRRLEEIESSPAGVPRTTPPPADLGEAIPPTPPAAAETPAPAPEAADPFGDDLAEGEPNVTADDALEGAMDDPFAGEAAPAAGAGGETPPADDDPFGGNDTDPFGGDGDDPFAP